MQPRAARKSWASALAGALLLLAGCATRPTPPAPPPPPEPPREFRAAWIATVANIDWPSRSGLPVAQQREELAAILDRAHALNLNALILQVRPAADALYPSALEPWTEYLTGEQGRDPGYDPLAEWVAGAHARGLELHAWFNPYRARHHEAQSPLAPTHLARTHPAVVKAYGKLLWMDPGEPLAAERTLAVIRDVVRRYDVDGVHLDDYFYPYPIPRPGAPGDAPETLAFPDEPSWQRYRADGGRLARADWRRDHVNRLVEQVHRAIHELKPHVLFGISPFGVGRPDRRPPGVTGFSQFDQLHAEVEHWLERGWLDFLAPQLYWRPEQPGQPFGVLLDYWAGQNPARRHLWPGLFTSALNDTAKSWAPEDILREIALTRARPAATGQIHFSMVALMEDRHGIATALAAGPYATPALVPATPWLDAQPPAPPTLQPVARLTEARGTDRLGSPDGQAGRESEKRGRGPRATRADAATAPVAGLRITAAAGEPAARWAVWRRVGGAWHFSVQAAAEMTVALAPTAGAGAVTAVAVRAVDRSGNASAPTVWRAPADKVRRP